MELNPFAYKFLKYILCGLSAYFILQYVAKNKISETDMILISVIVMLLFIIVDYIMNMMSNETDKTECTSVCSMREHFSQQENHTPITISNVPVSAPTVQPVPAKPQQIDAEYAKVLASMGQLTNVPSSEQTFIASDKISRNEDGSYNIKVYHNPQATSVGSRAEDGVLRNEVQYSDYNSLPPNLNTGSFEYGYSFLPPANWYPVPPHPPICVTEKQCPVCPVYTTGTNIDLKEWDSARRITQPDGINVKFVEEKLNSGR
ncbi:7tm chemosensory receptor/ankyrin repeat domain-containing protein [Bodo saltans virus]|uniref:7tm chemosensory receptor/ankyrin repeat domain-containing protein n=1 Tax=Bodo saltans virus TaxID=2024608 RepID=A0A2H4UUI3_9VIRU|nr:7tm chemosensory receptor/ankyrin repeat domain-containing protein [Bodo saltans virus]ATZ80499.1 7tm chemosensory receptor/ankyrin repeat domain-containing protein [Bodo saltans virus]